MTVENEDRDELIKAINEIIDGKLPISSKPFIFNERGVSSISKQRKQAISKMIFRKCLSDISIMATELGGLDYRIVSERYSDEIFDLWLKLYQIFQRKDHAFPDERIKKLLGV